MNIVIVGGGFGGVKTALELAKNSAYKVTLVSDKDYLLFYPALYATATGRSRTQSIIPLSIIFKNSSVKVVQDTVVGVDMQRRIVVGAKKQYGYDRAVFAIGVVTSYFGIKGLDTFSFSIKSDYELSRFKKHLHETLIIDNKLDKNYIVVGAGPTGVELSASLASYLRKIAKQHKIAQGSVKLSLVEAAPRILPRMSEVASRLAAKRLKKLRVKVMTNKKVEAEDDDGLFIDGREVPSKTVVWTSGVANHPFFAAHPEVFALAPNGRVIVNDQLYAAKNIFVIGDNAATKYVGLAQVAISDAMFVVKVLRAERKKRRLPVYSPKQVTSVIPIGRRWSLLQYKSLVLSGWIAALIRRAADFVAYLDLLPVPVALRLWWSSDQPEENCRFCK